MTYAIDGTNIEINTPVVLLKELTSVHGLLRVIERTGTSEAKALRMIRNAWIHGTDAEQLPQAWQRTRIARMASFKHDGPTVLRVYRDYLFIFSHSGVLITLLFLPGGFFRKRRYDNTKQPVRHLRRYMRMCGDTETLCA